MSNGKPIVQARLSTSFAKLREKGACEEGYKKLAKYLGGVTKYGKDTEINLLTILESNGFDDCVWCLRATLQDSDNVKRHIAADFAESVLHIYEKAYPTDNRPRKAVEAAHMYADGEISHEVLASLRNNATYAADSAAYAVAVAATYAAVAATYAADSAAFAVAVAATYAAVAAAKTREEKKQQLTQIVKKYLIADVNE
jgi:hypothetical protein